MCSGDMCVRAASTGHASIGHLLMVAEQVSDSRGGRNTLHAANNTRKRLFEFEGVGVVGGVGRVVAW